MKQKTRFTGRELDAPEMVVVLRCMARGQLLSAGLFLVFLMVAVAGYGQVTFTKITTGPIVTDPGSSWGGAWADYDGDGYLDLFVANGYGDNEQTNFLYHNNGNSNAWLKVKLVGTRSNRSGIGAKVGVSASISGKTVRQLRQISGGNGFGSQGTLLAHFGLGNATNIDTVRIEWPSGVVQELKNVAVRQFLTITEPPALQALVHSANEPFQLLLTSWAGLRYALETSANLKEWTPWQTVTATNRITRVEDPTSHEPQRFYRARPAN